MKGLNFVLLQTLGIPFKSVKVGQANREGVNSRNHQATALGSIRDALDLLPPGHI